MNEDAHEGVTDGEASRSEGNPAYVGYEYQIEVTVWIALDLMIAREATRSLTVEPTSREDVEAEVTASDPRERAEPGEGQTLLTIQAKSRSTGPWSSPDFSAVLTGKKPRDRQDAARRRGPPPRARPLRMLVSDPRRKYVLVTDADIEPLLFPYRLSDVRAFGSADGPPGHSGRTVKGSATADVGRRIGIVPTIDRERLRHRTELLLRRHGHVPLTRIDDCRRALVASVRSRILGEERTPLTRDLVLKTILSFQGAVLPDPQLALYVPPRNFPAIRDRLEKGNVVILAGPSGTGKTMTAEVLEEEVRRDGTGFSVMGGDGGPEAIATALRSPDPVLFHLRDPWGTIRATSMARTWSAELVKLIRRARPEKKFLITTRSDVMSEGGAEAETLKGHVIEIEAADYDGAALRLMYERHLSTIDADARDFGFQVREEVLKTLVKPFEIDRFVAGLGSETGHLPSRLDELMKRSQVEAIARVVADQVDGVGDPEKGVRPGALVWALATALGSVRRADLSDLERRMQRLDSALAMDAEGFVERMRHARNLKVVDGRISFPHPQVDNGFRLALEGRRSEARRVVSAVIHALLDLDATPEDADAPRSATGRRHEWGAGTANGMRREILKAKLPFLPSLPPETMDVLDGQLVSAALNGDVFVQRFKDLALLAGAGSVPGRLAKILVYGRRVAEREDSPVQRGFGIFWSLPKAAVSDLPSFAADPDCATLAGRFITETLPVSSTWYDGESVVGFLRSVVPRAEEAFLRGLRRALKDRASNANSLRVLVRGTLSGESPPYEAVLDLCLAALRTATRSFEGRAGMLKQADEQVLDAGHATHLYESLQDEAYPPTEALHEAVAARRRREGWEWLPGRPNFQELLEAWAKAIRQQGAPPAGDAELESVLASSIADEARSDAWQAVASQRRPAMPSILRREMAVPGHARRLRHAWLAAFAAAHGPGWFAELRSTFREGDPGVARLVEVGVDLASLHLDRDLVGEEVALAPRPADAFASDWPGLIGTLATLAADRARSRPKPGPAGVADLGVDALDTAIAVLPSVASDVRALLLPRLPGSAALEGLARRTLLDPADGEAQEAAVVALARSGESSIPTLVGLALKHANHRVRAMAVTLAAPGATGHLVTLLVGAAGDESSAVRLSFARAMAEALWPEARDALCALLDDERDFAEGSNYEGDGACFEVARAAATALGLYQRLDASHVTSLAACAGRIPWSDEELAPMAAASLRGR